MQGEALECTAKRASSHRFYSPVAAASPERHFVVKFHFTLCVSIDFIESLDKIGHVVVKEPGPLCARRAFRLNALDAVLEVSTLPLLLEAWVSASFGVRKRRGSLAGLVPDMLMDCTCTI